MPNVDYDDARSYDWLELLELKVDQDALVVGRGNEGYARVLARDCRSVRTIEPENLNSESGRYGVVVVQEWPEREARSALGQLSNLCGDGAVLCIPATNRLFPFRSPVFGRRPLPLLTRSALERMLRNAGFDIVHFYAPLPYPVGVPLFYVPVDEVGAWAYFLDRLFPQFALASPEVRRRHFVAYGAARFGIAVARLLRAQAWLLTFVPGWRVVAIKRQCGRG